MDTSQRPAVEVNGVTYRGPARPVVVVCIDGGDPRYLDRGLKDGILPNIGRFMRHGFSAIADGVVPSFTNPNNISIITGSPPAVHGISANFFVDPETGTEVMMNDPKFIWSDTLLGDLTSVPVALATVGVVALTTIPLSRLLAPSVAGGGERA